MAAARDPLDDLREEVRDIRARNERVEREKGWETSWTRRCVIAGATWLAAWLWLLSLGVANATGHALVPAAAYMLSTLSLPFVKSWWMRNDVQ